jgi:hypothetical protein
MQKLWRWKSDRDQAVQTDQSAGLRRGRIVTHAAHKNDLVIFGRELQLVIFKIEYSKHCKVLVGLFFEYYCSVQCVDVYSDVIA